MRELGDPLYDSLRAQSRSNAAPSYDAHALEPLRAPEGPLVVDVPEDDPPGETIDMLLALGASPLEATRYVHKLVKHRTPISFWECYGRGALREMAASSSGLDSEG